MAAHPLKVSSLKDPSGLWSLFWAHRSAESPLTAITASLRLVLSVLCIWKTQLVPRSSPEMDSFQTQSEADSKSKSFSSGHGETGAKLASRPSSWVRPRSRWIWSEAGHGRAGAGKRGREGSSPSCINLSMWTNPPILQGNASIFPQ